MITLENTKHESDILKEITDLTLSGELYEIYHNVPKYSIFDNNLIYFYGGTDSPYDEGFIRVNDGFLKYNYFNYLFIYQDSMYKTSLRDDTKEEFSEAVLENISKYYRLYHQGGSIVNRKDFDYKTPYWLINAEESLISIESYMNNIDNSSDKAPETIIEYLSNHLCKQIGLLGPEYARKENGDVVWDNLIDLINLFTIDIVVETVKKYKDCKNYSLIKRSLIDSLNLFKPSYANTTKKNLIKTG